MQLGARVRGIQIRCLILFYSTEHLYLKALHKERSAYVVNLVPRDLLSIM